MHKASSILKQFGLAIAVVALGALCTPAFAQQNNDAVSLSDLDEDGNNHVTSQSYKITRRVSSISKGYRVQIYSGSDREAAKAVKVSFMKRFPAIRSYISYEAPYYKIRVGDFKSRKDALELSRHLSKTYPASVVPSLINNRIPPKPKPEEQNPQTNNTTDSAR